MSENGRQVQDLKRLENLVHKHVITNGGRIALGYSDLSDTSGASPHDKVHTLNNTADHNGISGAVENNICTFDDAGFPKDSGSSLTSMSLIPTEITDHASGEAGKYYVTNNITRLNIVLPDVAAFGDRIGVVGKGAGGWAIGCNNGQYINIGDIFTYSGGGLESNSFTDGVVLMCITANTNWSVIWSVGNIKVEVA